MDIIQDVIKQLMALGPEGFTVVGVIAIGFILGRIRAFKNEWIPAVCPPVGCGLYLLLGSPSAINPSIRNPWAAQAIIGAALGLISWMAHASLIKRFADKIPWLKALDDSDPPPPAAGNQDTKTTNLLLMCLLPLVFMGCTTTSKVNPDGSTTTTRTLSTNAVKTAANTLRMGAKFGAIACMNELPKSRGYFEAAVSALTVALDGGQVDTNTLTRCLRDMPIGELQSNLQVQSTILDIIENYGSLAGDFLGNEIDKVAFLRAALTAVRDGFSMALTLVQPTASLKPPEDIFGDWQPTRPLVLWQPGRRL